MPDTRFAELRRHQMRALLQIGPVGSAAPSPPTTGGAASAGRADADAALYVHMPSGNGGPSDVVDALYAAAAHASPAARLHNATHRLGLPPGPARSFDAVDAAPHVATLTDFDSEYRGGGRFGSRFDTLEAISASRVCAAASVAARAWWSLAGGTGDPAVNCSLVGELLRCLLPSDGTASPAAASEDGASEDGAVAAAACPLAASLGLHGLTESELHSHYTGVFISTPSSVSIAPTARFVSAFLERTLNATCDAAVPSAATGCEPTLAFHDAYSLGIERTGEPTPAWRVADVNEPLCAPRALSPHASHPCPPLLFKTPLHGASMRASRARRFVRVAHGALRR